MSVLIFSLDYPPNDGGISRLVSGAVAAFEASGEKVQVVTLASGARTGLPRPGGEVVEVDRRKGLRDVQMLRLVRQHLRHYGPNAPILTSVWNPEATLAMLAGARRVTVLAHGNEVMPYPRKGWKARLRRLVLERARVVVCNSGFTETLVRQIAPAARTAVLNPAVDADRFHSPISRQSARARLDLPASKRIILTVARLDPIKGHETVLRAIAELTEAERASLFYVMIGKGEMRERLSTWVHELGLESYVRFAGFVADADLPIWYRAADLFVLSSFVDPTRRGMEGFGMALTEAQAAGLPVIGTRSGGIPDAVREGEGGWLIEEHDHVALAGHLHRLHDTPEIFAEQGRRGAERVRRDMTSAGYVQRLREII